MRVPGPAAAVAAAATIVTLAFASPAAATTETFGFTGGVQQWTVPPGVHSATFDVFGAEGCCDPPIVTLPGLGGRAVTTIAVTPGDTYTIVVGESGSHGQAPSFNGGGDSTRPGGGASDVRFGGTTLADRIIVAGGGGGAGTCGNGGPGDPGNGGGNGGGAAGEPGTPPAGGCAGDPGGGGTDSAGGTATSPGVAGAFGVGGDATGADLSQGGAGGGGWYGGGSGSDFGAGGGGSGHGPAGTVFQTGVHTGDGEVDVTYFAAHSLSVVTTGSGSGFVDSTPDGIDCGAPLALHLDCGADFADGTAITLTAHPAAGSTFDSFTGDVCSASPCDLTLGGDETITATFDQTPPTATTGVATGVGTTTASLAGTVNPSSAPTTYHFEYGPTTLYGSATAETAAGSDAADHAAGATLVGLAPATGYHYRLVATNAGGVTNGSDATFTTATPSPPPTTTVTTTAPAPTVTTTTPAATTTVTTPVTTTILKIAPAPRTCHSARRVTLTLRAPHGAQIASAVAVAPRTVKAHITRQTRHGKPVFVLHVDLRGRLRGSYPVRVTLHSADGHTSRRTHTYHVCGG
jgi:Glycine rich protein/Divergent InlB B-repeat domain